MIFPITKRPLVGWGDEREDNVIRTEIDAGYRVTRPRFTKARVPQWGPFTWQYLTDEEYQTLMDFYDNTTGSGSAMFEFTAYTRGQEITRNVRFASPPKATYYGYGYWLVQCTFEEV